MKLSMNLIYKLIELIKDKSKNRVDFKEIALALKKAAMTSYRLDKTFYDPINLALLLHLM